MVKGRCGSSGSFLLLGHFCFSGPKCFLLIHSTLLIFLCRTFLGLFALSVPAVFSAELGEPR